MKCVQTPVQLEHTILTATRSVIVTMELSVTMSMASAIVFQGSKEPSVKSNARMDVMVRLANKCVDVRMEPHVIL